MATPSPFPSEEEFRVELRDYYLAMTRISAQREGKEPLFLPAKLFDDISFPLRRIYTLEFSINPSELKLADPHASLTAYLKACNRFLQTIQQKIPEEACLTYEKHFLYQAKEIDLVAAYRAAKNAAYSSDLAVVGLVPQAPEFYRAFSEDMPRFWEREPISGTPEERREWRRAKREFEEGELARWKEDKKRYEAEKRKADKERDPMEEALAQSIFYCMWYSFPKTYSYEVPFQLPLENRLAHQWVISPTGGGKTTLLESQIITDIDAVARGECAVVVIDSQAIPGRPSLINNLSRLKVFASGQPLHEKLVYLEPDPKYPLALNLLDVGQNTGKDDREKEMFETAAGEMVQFSIAAMNDAQADLFSFVMQFLLSLPDATVDDLENVLGETGLQTKRYQDHLKTVDPTVQKFFAGYDARGHAATSKLTREAVFRRVIGMLKNPTFRRMFKSKTNRFNMLREISEPKVILINTDLAFLGQQGCESFGRFFIAQLVHAMQTRDSELPVLVYIDEMQDYLSNDQNLETLNDKARKRNIGMIYSHQRLDNIESQGIKNSLMSLDIQFTGGNRADAQLLAQVVKAKQEDIETVPRGTFMLYVRGQAPTAVRVNVRELFSQRQKMTEEDFAVVRQRMRDKYARPQKEEAQPAPEPTPSARQATPEPNTDDSDAKPW